MNKRIGLIIGLVALLAVGGFTAVQFSSAQDREGEFAPGTMMLERVIDDGAGAKTVTVIVEPSSQLPNESPAASGVLAGHEGNTLLVGTGDIELEVENINGEVTMSTSHSGPALTVLLTDDTVYYKDVTEIPDESAETGEYRFEQQITAVSSLDGMGDAAELMIFGETDGDVITADIVVFGEVGH